MTPRPLDILRPARRLALVFSLTILALNLAGCDPRQMAYFLQPFEPTIAAPGPNLKGKRVVLISKAVPGALYDFPTLDRELTRELAGILRGNVKKIDLVDVDKVYAWDEAHPTWTDPGELADAFDADVVIDLEVQAFQIQDPASPGLFEGKSSVHIRVVERSHPKDDRGREIEDQPKENRVIYEADRDSAFPLRGPIPASAEVTHSSFKKRFLNLTASEISWHFISHATGDTIQDVNFD